ncbi:MAG: hypothetical protein KJI69_03165 [Patescibacteria group bacterium]|nr:hypothetical protein [Patescibacteria group bacterium]
MPNVNQIIIGIIVIVIVVVGIFLFSTGKITLVESPEEDTLAAETFSLAGKVMSVDAGNNSFVMTDGQSKQEFTIKIGDETEFIRLGFPFDPASPPENIESFVPERLDTTIEELVEGDFVFVRSSHQVESGKEVVDPIEIQILP